MCKNVFAINNGIIVLTFHELEFTKGRGRSLHGPESNARSVPGPRFFQRAGPANESQFFQRAGPDRQLRDDFSYGPGRAGK